MADKKLKLSAAFLFGASAFDIESTFKAFENSGHAVYEGNVLMRPILKGGRLPAYAVVAAADSAGIFAAYKLKKEGKGYWWTVPIAVGAVHIVTGSANLGLSRSYR